MLNLHIRKAAEATSLVEKEDTEADDRRTYTDGGVGERERGRNVGARIDWVDGGEVRGAQEISRNFRFSN